jgi:hypothetical protein
VGRRPAKELIEKTVQQASFETNKTLTRLASDIPGPHRSSVRDSPSRIELRRAKAFAQKH